MVNKIMDFSVCEGPGAPSLFSNFTPTSLISSPHPLAFSSFLYQVLYFIIFSRISHSFLQKLHTRARAHIHTPTLTQTMQTHQFTLCTSLGCGRKWGTLENPGRCGGNVESPQRQWTWPGIDFFFSILYQKTIE